MVPCAKSMERQSGRLFYVAFSMRKFSIKKECLINESVQKHNSGTFVSNPSGIDPFRKYSSPVSHRSSKGWIHPSSLGYRGSVRCSSSYSLGDLRSFPTYRTVEGVTVFVLCHFEYDLFSKSVRFFYFGVSILVSPTEKVRRLYTGSRPSPCTHESYLFCHWGRLENTDGSVVFVHHSEQSPMRDLVLPTDT